MKTLEKFLNYISIDTTSNSNIDKRPSCDNQFTLASKLLTELEELNVDDIYYDRDNCYLYALLKGDPNAKSVGFIAHLDTSENESGKNIQAKIINDYNGMDVDLGEGKVLRVKDYPDLHSHIGKTLITTSGKTLLGADDKAGIVEIMNMIEHFSISNEKHGDIYICFTSDEEIGIGADKFDFSKFKADIAYTVDGSSTGEISYENFNAATANIKINGVSTHCGTAKDKMVNSLLIANTINEMIPNEIPENTEGYEGFYHLEKINGDVSYTEMKYLIRDFTKKGFNNRKEILKIIIEKLNKKYNNSISLNITDSYYNMKEVIDKNYESVDIVLESMQKSGIEPLVTPIRGGTDGADISQKGLPCPNIGTGGHNFHSVYEYIALDDMDKTSELLVNIVKSFAKTNKQKIK